MRTENKTSSISGLILCVFSLFLIVSCGSAESIDRKALENEQNQSEADNKTDTRSTGNQLPNTTGRNTDLGGGQNGSVIKVASGCEIVLSLGTAAFNLAEPTSGVKGPQLALVGQVAAQCQAKEFVTLSITSNQPTRILIPLECQVREGQSGFIECKGPAKLVAKNGQISIPIELGGNLSEAQVVASASFEGNLNP